MHTTQDKHEEHERQISTNDEGIRRLHGQTALGDERSTNHAGNEVARNVLVAARTGLALSTSTAHTTAKHSSAELRSHSCCQPTANATHLPLRARVTVAADAKRN